MRWFPFISKSSHREILEVKEDQLLMVMADRDRAWAQVERLNQGSMEFQRSMVELLKPPPPPVEPKKIRREKTEEEEKPATLDLADVDPNDRKALTILAVREMPPGKQSGSILLRKIDEMRERVFDAKIARQSRAQEVATVPSAIQQDIDRVLQESTAAAQGA